MLRLNTQRQRSIPNENTKNKLSSFAFLRDRRIWSFHVVVLQRTAKKCTNIYNARAQLLFCSLILLCGDVFVAVVVVICLSSLMSPSVRQCLSHSISLPSVGQTDRQTDRQTERRTDRQIKQPCSQPVSKSTRP